MESLINYAVMYAKKGMSVLPMMNKKPLIQFKDKPALTVDEVKKMWTKYPTAQIALRTDNFFVVDIDVHEGGADGFKSLENFEYPEWLPETLSQKTAGGGKQLFYLKRDEIEVRQNIGWLDGVDIKAHKNNYVVVAPSKNSKGNKYQWLNKKPIVKAPKDLIRSINQTKRTNRKMNFNTNYNFSDEKTGTAKLFEDVVNGLGFTGGRNNALASFVGGLLYRNVGVEETYQLALLANQNTEQPLPIDELQRTYQSMVEKEQMRRKEAMNGS